MRRTSRPAIVPASFVALKEILTVITFLEGSKDKKS
jgi:hypothetical protein